MRGARILSVTVAALLVAAACQAPRATSDSTPAPSTAVSKAPDFTGKTLNIVTGGTGGVYIVYGAGLADMLTKRMKVAASAQSTPASVDNMKLIRDGKADLAFVLSDTSFDAINGKGRFAPPEAKVDAKAIAVMYSNYMHIVAKATAGINTVADLKGKRVSIGAAGSGTETKGIRILEAYGLNATTDIQPQRLNAQDSADALRDGKIDAFFFDGGLPTSAVTDIANSTAIKLLDESGRLARARNGEDHSLIHAIAAARWAGTRSVEPYCLTSASAASALLSSMYSKTVSFRRAGPNKSSQAVVLSW